MPATDQLPDISQSLLDNKPLTVEAMAELLDMSPRTVQRLLQSGELKTVAPRRKGRPPRITAASARAYLEGGAVS